LTEEGFTLECPDDLAEDFALEWTDAAETFPELFALECAEDFADECALE